MMNNNNGRVKIIPLYEQNQELATIGELIMNPWTADISTRTPQGNIVSATKNISKRVQTIENALKNTPNATSLNAVMIREEFYLVDSTTQIDPTDGKQVFYLQEGEYELGLNRLEVMVGVARFSAAKGNLIEVNESSFKLAENLPSGTVVEMKYYEVIKSPSMAFGLNVIIQQEQPDTNGLDPGTIWVFRDNLV